MDAGFWKAGHRPTLFAAFFYFDLSFMVWVMLGPLGVAIAADLALTPAQAGLMVATPVLAGALLRIPAGILVDHLKPRRTGLICQLLVIGGLLLAWLIGISSFAGVLALALVLGVAGAAFAVALPLASRWYPPHYQGTALGIAGAGNSGTALAALFAPALAIAFGWQHVIGLAVLPLLLALAVYVLLARDSPVNPPPRPAKAYFAPLRKADCWWFMFFYAVSFGGFSGLSSSLTIYFNDQYGMAPVTAGYLTAACVFAGSLVRPFGGAVADRVGGIRSLMLMYCIAAAALLVAGTNLPTALSALGVLVVAMLAMGMANGAVFQLVPQRFREEMGVMTGLVGMAGGVGGFALAAGLGLARQLSGEYSAGFFAFGAIALLALVGLVSVEKRWRSTWGVLVQARI